MFKYNAIEIFQGHLNQCHIYFINYLSYAFSYCLSFSTFISSSTFHLQNRESPVGCSSATFARDLCMVVIIINLGWIFIIAQQAVAVASMGSSIEVVGWTVRCRLCRACLLGTRAVTLIEMIVVAYYLRPLVPAAR